MTLLLLKEALFLCIHPHVTWSRIEVRSIAMSVSVCVSAQETVSGSWKQTRFRRRVSGTSGSTAG